MPTDILWRNYVRIHITQKSRKWVYNTILRIVLVVFSGEWKSSSSVEKKIVFRKSRTLLYASL